MKRRNGTRFESSRCGKTEESSKKDVVGKADLREASAYFVRRSDAVHLIIVDAERDVQRAKYIALSRTKNKCESSSCLIFRFVPTLVPEILVHCPTSADLPPPV